VKADGARTRLLKAPNEREPQIPASADRVVPVASAGAVGEPLTAETVHRPERVAAITDAAVGDEITPELVGRVLAHEEGGLKGFRAARPQSRSSMWSTTPTTRRRRERSLGSFTSARTCRGSSSRG